MGGYTTPSKAIQINKTGGTEVLEYVDTTIPAPAANQVLIKTSWAGLNFIETYFRGGLYPIAKFPLTLGSEAGGIITAVGSDLDANTWLNKRVVTTQCDTGSYASYTLAKADTIYEIPEGLSDEVAVAALLQGATAHYLTYDTHPVKPSDRVLVHAAAGGTGLLVSQMAKLRGAQLVVGVVGSAEKAEIARSVGKCDIAVDYTTTPDWKSAIQEQLGGDKFNVVYDAVGKSAFLPSLDLLKPRGHMVTFGNASGAVEPFSPLILSQKGSLSVTRPKLGDYMLTRQEGEARVGELLKMVKSGKLTVTIDRTFKLEAAAEAHKYIEGKKTKGKVLIDTRQSAEEISSEQH